MIIKNAKVLDSEKISFYEADVEVKDGKITKIGTDLTGDDIIDAKGKYLIPGLIDIHTHGSAGVDVLNSYPEAIAKMSEHYASHGVTTVFPTLNTAPAEQIKKGAENVMESEKLGTLVNYRGLHIEGPYLSKLRAGAHTISLLKDPDFEEFKYMISPAYGKKAIYCTIAPELPGSMDFIKNATEMGVRITVGHSDADGEVCKEALKNGAVGFTHLYNAMKPLHHREPGVVGMGLLSDAYTELICDGLHIHPDVVAMTYKVKGTDRLTLITDSMQAAGMPDGNYTLGDIVVTVVDGAARNPQGALAGSTLNLYDGVLNLMKFAGASFSEAVVCATRNPAIVTKIYDEVGSIEVGKAADFDIVSEDYKLEKTISGGKVVYNA